MSAELIRLPSTNYLTEGVDVAKLRVGDELKVYQPGHPRWSAHGMHCIVRAKHADGSVDVERVR